MKLSQIEKRIPQTLTNSKDVIQKGREYARRSSRARSTRGQENEAWALYKKNPSRVSWVDLSRDWYIALPKLATPAGNTFARGLLFTWDKRDSPKQTTCSSPRVKMRKKARKVNPRTPGMDVLKQWNHAFVKLLRTDVSVGFQRPYFCPSMRHLHGVFMQSFISLGKTFFLLMPGIFINFYFPDSGVYFEWFGFLFLMAWQSKQWISCLSL